MLNLCCAACLLLMLVFSLPADEVPATLQSGKAAGDLWENNGLGMKFRWCPPGKFTMGSPESERTRGYNETQEEATISNGYWLGQYEVTQVEWQKVMGTTIEQQRDKYSKKPSLYGTGSTHPVYFVSWEDVMEFCKKLTSQERAAGRLPSDWEYTLPTEAQWEYACRAETTTATAFGDKLDSTQANFDGNIPYNGATKGEYKEQTVAVGSYQANAWNLYDMHGNVFEWCRESYATKILLRGDVSSEFTLQTSSRVYRGGGWFNAGAFCRSAGRFWADPDDGNADRGFRLALVQIR